MLNEILFRKIAEEERRFLQDGQFKFFRSNSIWSWRVCKQASQTNPHAYIEKPTHPKRVTVWCGFWSRSIIGPFFFENKQGEVVYSQCRSLSGHVEWIFIHKNWEEGIGNIWFQKDGATCHTAEAILDVLRLVFEDRIISRRADIVWPLRSCDLTSLDYYLWGAFKPETIDALKDNICETIGEIQLHAIDTYIQNWPLQPFS